MTKTLAVILNHNLPEYTDLLYNSLVSFQRNDYHLIVMDNGSRPDLVSKNTSIRFQANLFWGGAFNEAFKMVLNNPEYDSLLFLNNDIEVTGEIFVRSLRDELFKGNYAMISPCIAGRAQPWKQMQNWGNPSTRIVKWIDMQAPLINRKLIEKINQFDPALYYGWGQELICMDICESMGWKTGVCDFICILHVGKQTVFQNRLFNVKTEEFEIDYNSPITWQEYLDSAWESYVNYFAEHPLKNGEFYEMRAYGEQYSCVTSSKK